MGARENGFRDFGFAEWFVDTEDPHFPLTVIILQVHLIKLEYCFYWQLLREMQINTFGTLYSHFVPYHAHCVCPHLRL